MRGVEPLRVVCVPPGWVLEPVPGETVLDAALRVHRPLASSCGGRAVCGDCRVTVVAGGDAAGPLDAEETAWRTRTGYAGPERLACCLRPLGSLTITTGYW